MSYNQVQPRLRVNTASGLTLSTTYQKVNFNGTSSYNINTFGIDPVSMNSMVKWDSTNKIFNCYDVNDKNYDITLYFGTTSTLLTTPTTLRYRFTIPNGINSGVDLHFPFPDSAGYEDLVPITYVSPQYKSHNLVIYLNSAIRSNGMYLEVALSTTSLGTIMLTEAALLLTSFIN